MTSTWLGSQQQIAGRQGAVVRRGSNGSLPEGAVRLSDWEVIELQWQAIANHKDPRVRWPFTFGTGCLAGLTAATGVFANVILRRKLNLGRLSFFASYLPTAVIPAVLTALLQHSIITRNILLEHFDCPVCLPLRSTVMQTTLGWAYPVTLVPIASALLARRHRTYPIPPISDFAAFLREISRATHRNRSAFGFLLLANAFAAYFVTQQQQSVLKHQSESAAASAAELRYEH